jgi:hypothetical protein
MTVGERTSFLEDADYFRDVNKFVKTLAKLASFRQVRKQQAKTIQKG